MNNTDEKMKTIEESNAGVNHADASNADASSADEKTSYSIFADDGYLKTNIIEICAACANYACNIDEFIELIKTLVRIVKGVPITPYLDEEYLNKVSFVVGVAKSKDWRCKK